MKIKTILKNKVRRNEAMWTTKKAEKALLQIAGTIALILTLNVLINVAQAEPTVYQFENTPIDFGTSIAPESEHLNDDQNDEGKDGTAVDIVSKIEQAFPGNKVAKALAQAESGLNPKKHSDTDRMKDGRAFSVGVMQINLTVHKVGDKDCTKAFSGRNYQAKVINEALYQECVKLAENPDVNLTVAKGIYERSGNTFNSWGAYLNNSFIKFL